MNAKMLSMKYLLPFVVMLVLVSLMRHITSFINTKYTLGLNLTFQTYLDTLKKNKESIVTPSDILLSILFVSVICCSCKGNITKCGTISFILYYIFSLTNLNDIERPYINGFFNMTMQKGLLLNALGFGLAAAATCAIFRKQMM